MSLLTNLVSYYRLDESSGDALDARGTNTLADHGSCGTAAGKAGTARSFDGSTQYLAHADNADLSTGDVDFTIACWFKTATTVRGCLVGKDVDSPANSRDYTLDVFTAAPRFYINGGTTGGALVAAPSVSTGTWYHVVAWHDSVNDELGICLNAGTPTTAATGGVAPQDSAAEFRIGARAYSGVEDFFTGSIDEVGFWKRVLTPSERASLYNGGAGLAYPGFGGGGTFRRSPGQRPGSRGVLA